MRYVIVAACLLAAATAGWLSWETSHNRLVWDHFDVVKRGVLYRSGQLNGEQLRAAVARYGIRTVVNFQVPGAAVEIERVQARRLGVDFLSLPMSGDGFGQEVAVVADGQRAEVTDAEGQHGATLARPGRWETERVPDKPSHGH